MKSLKSIITLLTILFTTNAAFCQSEELKNVVNKLAFYNQKKDLKFLAGAKKSIDSLITTKADSADLAKSVYRAVVNSSILYLDSLNTLKQPETFFKQTVDLVERVDQMHRSYRYQPEIDFAKKSLANVYIRKAFLYMNSSDFINALKLFKSAEKFAPGFKQLNTYIAYSNNKLGNLNTSAKYYTDQIGGDSTKAEYVEAASTIYKSMGDTIKALDIIKKGRKLLPNDRSILLDEANIYNNKHDYRSLEPLLPTLLDLDPNNSEIAFVAANCYDHLNRYDKAESLYLRAIELNNSAYEPVFNLGLLYFKEAEFKKDAANKSQNSARAIQWLAKANEISPNDVKCLQLLKIVYARNGDNSQLNNINNKLKQLTN